MCSDKSKQSISLERCSELKTRIQDYLDIKDTIPKGLSPLQEEKILSRTESDWNDWKWQLKNRISDVSLLSKIINLTDSEIDSIKKVEQKYRWGISPYYTSLIDDDDKFNPIKLQSIPTFLELDDRGVLDPMSEEYTNPAGSITRRYPDRLIIMPFIL